MAQMLQKSFLWRLFSEQRAFETWLPPISFHYQRTIKAFFLLHKRFIECCPNSQVQTLWN